MGIECLDQLSEVGERAGQPIDLIDDDHIDASCRYGCSPASTRASLGRQQATGSESCANGASPNHFFNGRYLRDNLTALSLGSLAA